MFDAFPGKKHIVGLNTLDAGDKPTVPEREPQKNPALGVVSATDGPFRRSVPASWRLVRLLRRSSDADIWVMAPMSFDHFETSQTCSRKLACPFTV